MRLTFFIIIVLIIAFVSFCGCTGSSSGSSVTGTYTNPDLKSSYYEIHPDGTYYFSTYGTGQYGKYVVVGNKLRLTNQYTTEEFTINNGLLIKNLGNREQLWYKTG